MGTFAKTFCGKSPFKMNSIERARHRDKLEWEHAKANRKKRRYSKRHSK